jgi:hypothetical protein
MNTSARVFFSRTPVLAFFVALCLGILNNWTNQFASGYQSGLNDHAVLSLMGIQWADPSKFVNDWFLDSAPQPHWLFDVVTYIGAATGSISWLYFIYWCCGLIAFGFATVLLAKKWAPGQVVFASLALTAIISQTPWYVVGSGSTMISQALPTVLAGQIMYLTLALLITDNRRLVPWFAALIGLVHVQQGAVIGIILLASWGVDWLVRKKLDWRLLAGSIGAIAATIFGLALRPVAANLSDFIDVCETIIPYHCAAHTWGIQGLLAFSGLIALGLLTICLMTRLNRHLWLTSVGLAGVGLWLGMLVDALQVPVLGQLAQATNIYRLGALIIPFAAWGILLPVLIAKWSRSFIVVVVLWSISLGLYFLLPEWPTGGRKASIAIISVIAASAICIAWIRHRYPTIKKLISRSRHLGLALTGSAFIIAAAIAGSIIVRPLTIQFIPNDALTSWGKQVEGIVPSGQIILTPPLATSVRIATGRAIIVDCKTVPYGGVAWKQWKERINALGGSEQCTHPYLSTFDLFTAVDLDRVAKKYGANFMVLDPSHFQKIESELSGLGWNLELPSPEGLSVVLLSRNK